MKDLPESLSPVVAKIQHINSLGTSTWWEVVYYDGDTEKWHPFAGSNTFDDGEAVVGWVYCDGLESANGYTSLIC